MGTLYTKGITEETTQLIVSDGAQRLEKALYSHLQYKALVTHDTEVSSAPSRQAKQGYKQAILVDAAQIYATDVEAEIRVRAQACQDQWKGEGMFQSESGDYLVVPKALLDSLDLAPPDEPFD